MFTALKSPTTIALSGEYAAIEMFSLSILIKAKYSEEDDIGGAYVKQNLSVACLIFRRCHTHSIPERFRFGSLLTVILFLT